MSESKLEYMKQMTFSNFLKTLVDVPADKVQFEGSNISVKETVASVEVSINEALDIKQAIVSYLNKRLKNVKEDNSHPAHNECESNVLFEYKEYRAAKTFLAGLKAAIARCNSESGAIDIIFQQEELRDEYTSLDLISTKHGKIITDVGRYNEDTAEVVYVAHLRKADIDKRKAELELELRRLNTQLKLINASQKISINMPST